MMPLGYRVVSSNNWDANNLWNVAFTNFHSYLIIPIVKNTLPVCVMPQKLKKNSVSDTYAT